MNINSVVEYVKTNKKNIALKAAKFAGIAATVIVADAVARKLNTPDVVVIEDNSVNIVADETTEEA